MFLHYPHQINKIMMSFHRFCQIHANLGRSAMAVWKKGVLLEWSMTALSPLSLLLLLLLFIYLSDFQISNLSMETKMNLAVILRYQELDNFLRPVVVALTKLMDLKVIKNWRDWKSKTQGPSMTNFCQEKAFISQMKLSDRKKPTNYEDPMGGERHFRYKYLSKTQPGTL